MFHATACFARSVRQIRLAAEPAFVITVLAAQIKRSRPGYASKKLRTTGDYDMSVNNPLSFLSCPAPSSKKIAAKIIPVEPNKLILKICA